MKTFDFGYYISKDNFLYQQLSDTYRTALQNLINIVVEEYLSYTPMFNKYFTDHGPFHSKEITDVVTKLVKINSDILSRNVQADSSRGFEPQSFLNEDECFILLASIWLHDIGMIYNIDPVTGQILYEQIHRAKHAKQSIELLFKKRKELFIYTLPYSDRLIKLISDVCVNHTTSVKEWVDYLDEFDELVKSKIRTKLLIALLRIGDILDLRQKRAPLSLRSILKIPTISLMHWDVSELIDFYEIEEINAQALVYIQGKAAEDVSLPQNKHTYKYPLFLYKYTQIINEYKQLEAIFSKYGFNIKIKFEFSHNNFCKKISNTALEQDSLKKFHSNNDENILFYKAHNFYLRENIISLYKKYDEANLHNKTLLQLQMVDKIANYISQLTTELIDLNAFSSFNNKDSLLKANLENIEWLFTDGSDAKHNRSTPISGSKIIQKIISDTHQQVPPPTSYFTFRQYFLRFGEFIKAFEVAHVEKGNIVANAQFFDSFGIEPNATHQACLKFGNKKHTYFNVFKSLGYLEDNMYNIHQYNTLLMFLRLGYTKEEHPSIYREIGALVTNLRSKINHEDYISVHNHCNLCTGRLLSILCYYLGINQNIEENEKKDIVLIINRIIDWLTTQEEKQWATIRDDDSKIYSSRYTAAVLNGLIDYYFFFIYQPDKEGLTNPYFVKTDDIQYGKGEFEKIIISVLRGLECFKINKIKTEGDDWVLYSHVLMSINNYKRIFNYSPELQKAKVNPDNIFKKEFENKIKDELANVPRLSILNEAAIWPIYYFRLLITEQHREDILHNIKKLFKYEGDNLSESFMNNLLAHAVWNEEDGSWGNNITETFHFLICWMVYWEDTLRKQKNI